jgi:uncharacterized protein (DUF885 family)
MQRTIVAGCFVVALVCGLAARAAERTAEWNALVDEYLDKVYFPLNPTVATQDGVHQYDSEMEDYSQAGQAAEVKKLREFVSRVEQFPTQGLPPVDAADRQILIGRIKSDLLTLEKIRPLEKNPDAYSAGVTNSVYLLMNRKFAAVDDRLRSAVEREKKIPGILAIGRENLNNPPRIYTEIAIQQLPGIIGFYEKDVPLAFADARDPETMAQFAKSNAEVIAALKKYAEWLKTDLLDRSHGDFRIGAEIFGRKLEYEEMVDTPLDRLLEVGNADLLKNQAAMKSLAREIDPSKTPEQVMAELGSMHPSPARLMETFRGTFDGLITFIQQKYILTIPNGLRPIVQETPPFERATTTASMDTPGPFETKATEAYFNVTLPAPEDTPAEAASLMAGFNIGTIVSTSTHETYPGHFMQYLWTSRAPTKLRKAFYANTNAEGWAHYCEQMMLDEGYGQPGTGAQDARDAKYIRLGQLQDALLRDARFVVGIKMHTGKMSFEEAKEFFVKEGYQSAKVAEIESKRGTSDPTYLYYTLGKLQILKLRDDYKKRVGTTFVLGKFHDEFMGQGEPPIAVVRQAMLGDGSPTL